MTLINSRDLFENMNKVIAQIEILTEVQRYGGHSESQTKGLEICIANLKKEVSTITEKLDLVNGFSKPEEKIVGYLAPKKSPFPMSPARQMLETTKEIKTSANEELKVNFLKEFDPSKINVETLTTEEVIKAEQIEAEHREPNLEEAAEVIVENHEDTFETGEFEGTEEFINVVTDEEVADEPLEEVENELEEFEDEKEFETEEFTDDVNDMANKKIDFSSNSLAMNPFTTEVMEGIQENEEVADETERESHETFDENSVDADNDDEYVHPDTEGMVGAPEPKIQF
ncbi:hypothetical protein [Kurthia sibirica]|uniref:Uncharacterized protein n=1 Tax=Kurthia sibirica TaxID=202750 RepID=A0A2U3AKA9_9BACL|nr:hypothetical protein [Kurthia sibirica]PWI24967.1 hypothetical protein DEX24_10355 [Kurthia sibirica]GEK33127.1 hypothetical protein KSI01_06600 [Kurthia sibirica]